IGSMVGGGVFALSGTAIETAGPGAIVAFIMAGIIVLFSALSLAVVAGKTPAGEAGYDEVGDILGKPWEFVTSWCFYLNAVIVTAFVLNAFGLYFHEFVMNSASVLTIGIIAAVALGFINFAPAGIIGRFESVLVIIKLAVLAFLIIVGLPHLTHSSLSPLLPHGSSGLMSAGSTLFIAFLGFNVITNISVEIDNARKNVPRAIVASMIIVTIVYIGVVLAMLAAHLGTYTEASVGVAAQKLAGPIGGIAIVVGALLATLSAANANMLGASETIMRMAEKKSVPTILGLPFHRHPIISVSIGVIVAIGLMMSGQINFVVNLANVTAIVALIVINLAALRIFWQQRGKRTVAVVMPLIGIVGAAWQFMYLSAASLWWGAGLIAAGLVMYVFREKFIISHHHKRISKTVRSHRSPLVAALRR
ncbi:MAG TPA: APC family permease, partial [Candidatus Saccharimonadaceae bacterium]|nr:APC family permease [Candidatus Saccharimonadaceae bacterium]